MGIGVIGGLKVGADVRPTVADGTDRRQRLIILLDLRKVLFVQKQTQLPTRAR
jgi:hypothetical protein